MAGKKAAPVPAFTITIDDFDRLEKADKPWVAIAYSADGDSLSLSGLGATPRAALGDLLNELDRARENHQPDYLDFFTDQEA